MISRVIILIFLSFSSLFSIDLTSFEGRAQASQDIKGLILKEEEMSKAYEEYILENYDVPTTNDLVGTSTLLESTFLDSIDTTLFNKISIDSITKFTYGLKAELIADNYMKSLYESNTFRNRTFIIDDKVSFVIEDDFAKQLLYLIVNQTSGVSGIPDCPIPSILNFKYCKKDSHIYIHDDSNTELMYYHKDKFKTGPIIITEDTALHTNEEFTFIPKGAILYDTNGMKYVKTINSIELVR